MTDSQKMIINNDVVTEKKFQNSQKSLLISGLQQVRYLLETTLTPKTSIKSFLLTGEWDPKNGGCAQRSLLLKKKFTLIFFSLE